MKILVKAIITVVVLAGLTMLLNSLEPVVSGQLAVNQLNDTWTSNSNLTLYNDIKSYSWIGYIIIPLLVFFTDIKKLLTNSK